MTQEILFRYFRGEASPEEQRQIGAWLLSGVEAQQEFENAQFLYEGMILYGPDKRESYSYPFVRRVLRFARILGAAAVLAIVVAGAAFWAQYKTRERLSREMMAFSTPPGQRAELTLSDGTVVSLNADTRLEYPVFFGRDSREVKLEGEAFFQVRHESDRPFKVSTFATEIVVLGTSFSVEARQKEDLFSTVLLEGSVQVMNLSNPSDMQLMRPHDRVTLSGGRLVRTSESSPAILPWMRGLVSLDEARDFQDLMAQFERVYGVHIITRVNPCIDGLSGELRIAEGVEHALKVLQHLVDFQYEIFEGNIIIK